MIGVEKMKHGFPCDSGRQCAGQGGLMRRVRIAEQLSRQNLGVLAQQRFGIERGAGVVEIDLPARVQGTQVALRSRSGQATRGNRLGHARRQRLVLRVNDFPGHGPPRRHVCTWHARVSFWCPGTSALVAE